MKIVAETALSDTTIDAIVGELKALGFAAFTPSAKTDWTGKHMIVEQTFTIKGATITLTLDTNEPTPLT